MTSEPRFDIVRVLDSSSVEGGPRDAPRLSPAQQEIVLELAYLSAIADGDLSDAELVAVTALASRVRGRRIQGRELDALLDDLASRLEHRDAKERVVDLAASLGPGGARLAAYKVAFAIGLCDLAAKPDETEFDDALLQALGLSSDDADALESEVYAILDGERPES